MIARVFIFMNASVKVNVRQKMRKRKGGKEKVPKIDKIIINLES